MGKLIPVSRIAMSAFRHLGAAGVRYGRKLSQLRAELKGQVHAVLGDEGLWVPINTGCRVGPKGYRGGDGGPEILRSGVTIP